VFRMEWVGKLVGNEYFRRCGRGIVWLQSWWSESGRAHAALEGIFRVKGTDVKDDASRLPPTFYTTALRPCAFNHRASDRLSLPEYRDWR
jgi:hypothetical protein